MSPPQAMAAEVARPGVPGRRPDARETLDAILLIEGVCVRFGGVVALDQVSFDVRRGEICGLIGPNGAGKTTLFNCLSRLYRWNDGAILFEGRPLSAVPVHRIASIGIGRTFQNLALFRSLTVAQNVMLGAHCRTRGGFLANALALPRVRREEALLHRRAAELLDFVGLRAFADRRVGDLPFGRQKRVELARALAAEPKLLLLDEPAAGLNHEELGDLRDLIWQIRDSLGVSVLLVEHHMNLVMTVSDHVVVLNFGKRIAQGIPAEIRQHPEVVRAYLGAAA
jgi:branched-chain amino acid transport system ATP-binding protein